MTKLKKYFPYLSIIVLFFCVMVLQMSLYGTGTSASDVQLDEQKAQSYENLFATLELKTSKGKLIKLSDAKQPIVILNFWASWCRPCISEFETLKKMIDHFGKYKVLVIGINNDTDNPSVAVKKVEKKLNLNFDSVLDEGGTVTGRFNITEIPASIIFHNGKAIMFHNKEFDFMQKEFLSFIEKKIDEDR